MEKTHEARRSRLRRVINYGGGAGAAFLLISFLLQGGEPEPGEGAGALRAFGILMLAAFGGYYLFVGSRWFWRRLLWRVRRRLLITFLFIGLTPIVLLTLLGLLGGFVASAEAMSRMVSSQVRAIDYRVFSAARTLAQEFESLPEEPGPSQVGAWLAARRLLLQGSFLGVRLALWRETPGAPAAPAGSRGTPFVSAPTDEEELPIGPAAPPLGGPLPGWLLDAATWKGIAFHPPPPDSRTFFGSMSIRGLVRGEARGRPYALLVDVPVSRALVRHLRETTDLQVHPYFLASPETAVVVGTNSVSVGDPNRLRDLAERDPDGLTNAENLFDRRDQSGEALPSLPYWVMVSATDWTTGETSQRVAFVLKWSWAEASRHLLGGSPAGRILRYALVVTGLIFLGMEIAALAAALWMTRTVTRTVDDLHRATGHIDRGVFSHRVSPHSRDQLGDLALAFNSMSAHIESLLEERVKAERLEREVEIAAQVQTQLFPRAVPRLLTARLAGECRAARGVAGDYYDYLEVAPGLVLLALGDVSGKGISASLVMSNLQASLRAHTGVVAERARALPAPPGTGRAPLPWITSIVNDQLCRSTDANRYATLFLALYDDRVRRLRYINAGHNAAILVAPDGSVSRLMQGGTVVGAFESAVYEEGSAEFPPGSLLVIFSDGISETADGTGEFFGEERLARFCAESRGLRAEDLKRAIFGEIDRWAGDREREDDQTLVILKSEPGLE